MTATPGGSMLNTSVSLGKLGVPVFFLSEFGNDHTGNFISEYLNKYGVSTAYAYRFEGISSVALAYLDENSEASYAFYHDEHISKYNFQIPVFRKNDIVIIGSLYALMKANRPKIERVVQQAVSSSSILYYDPNFRKQHLPDLGDLFSNIADNIHHADILRGSDEDFKNIFNLENPYDVFDRIYNFGCNNLIYTAGSKGVWVITPDFSKKMEVPEIHPVSTIGAGDSFSAGIIYSLWKQSVDKSKINHLDEEQWVEIINTGINFAGHVCEREENYISDEFAAAYLKSQ
jgi:fructokinase